MNAKFENQKTKIPRVFDVMQPQGPFSDLFIYAAKTNLKTRIGKISRENSEDFQVEFSRIFKAKFVGKKSKFPRQNFQGKNENSKGKVFESDPYSV